MSYCRWSSDDFQCDVYVYQGVSGGWTTHVAGMRHVLAEELPPPLTAGEETMYEPGDYEAWAKREQIVTDIIRRSHLQSIGLPCDNENYSDPTPGACADRLENLRTAGYNVPQGAIDVLRQEEKEGVTNAPEESEK